ncbi:MAG: 4-(cytidine 5'-diphospho)-2-C-methyl-D-erythritol kinase [Bryobacteraceae bacterium]
MKSVRLKAFAKINLTLEVLNKRPDGFHNLRTIFQTISLADSLDVEYTAARKTAIELDSSVDITNNLVIRAAHAVLDAMRLTARIRFRLTKRIPMGGGLGGGSTDAAAVLLALPALAGREVPLVELLQIGERLGSDVPFFLAGGCALGLGRGAELYVLPDPRGPHGLLVAAPVHVSTAEAYSSLNRPENADPAGPGLLDSQDWALNCVNHFEPSVFDAHPELAAIKNKLRRLGAKPALMTGSGAAVFGMFDERAASQKAALAFPGCRVHPFTFVGRRRYREIWRKQLGIK